MTCPFIFYRRAAGTRFNGGAQPSGPLRKAGKAGASLAGPPHSRALSLTRMRYWLAREFVSFMRPEFSPYPWKFLLEYILRNFIF